VNITVHHPGPEALLLCGVPFAQGELESGGGLVLTDPGGRVLPLWWEERAHWPDNTVKWVCVHARLDPEPDVDTLVVALLPGAGEPAALDGPVEEGVELEGTRFEITEEGWVFGNAGGQAIIHTGRPEDVHTDPPLPVGGAAGIEVVEASAIAPLVRVRHEADSGLGFDHLLRIDPRGGNLHWRQRLNFLGDQVVALSHLRCGVTFTGQSGSGAWEWPALSTVQERLSVLRPGVYQVDGGGEVPGRPEARVRQGQVSVVLEKGWQRAPFTLSARGDGVEVELYPSTADPLTVHPGTSLRHTLHIGLNCGRGRMAEWSLDPEATCGSGAFGPLMPRSRLTEQRYPGYEQAMDACLRSGRRTRLDKERGAAVGAPAELADEASQDEEYFGLQHYGDWPMALGAYGGERRMYADNEYDTPYTYFLQFVRTGSPEYVDIAHASAVHMADVDCMVTTGDMRFHGYRETADDHAEHRPSGGELGHYWTDGLVLDYLLCDDLWSWESARAQVQYLMSVFAGEGDDPVRRHFLGCERAVGWPLVALAGVAEVTGGEVVLGKMQQMAAYLARFAADPDRELEEVDAIGTEAIKWWRIAQEDGCKPFMLGVVLEGLERYHRLTGDPVAEQAIVDTCRFLVEVMWVENVEAFTYEWNAFNRGHREESYPHYINMMVAPGLAYAYELTGETVFREVATRSFHAALWTLFAPGGGKEIGMVGRTSALMVGRLHEWKTRDLALRAQRLPPSNGLPFRYEGDAAHLAAHPNVRLRQGAPRYRDGALVSDGDSFAVYGFREPVGTDCGEISFTVIPDWDCPPHPGPVASRAYLHLSARPFTRSCVSVISFYTGLHVRFYDGERHYIEVLETDIGDWRANCPHRIDIGWSAGTAWLRVDGEESDRRSLDRRLSGAFERLHLGHRPGNWRAQATLTGLVLRLG